MPERKTFYKKVVSPFLDKRDSETWHHRGREALHFAEKVPGALFVLERIFSYQDPKLHVTIEGIQFENPVVVAAGWDKVGRSVKGLHALGFAGVEIGTIPEFPQTGNPKPREFMIADGVAINRFGFNSDGMEVAAQNLERYRGRNIPVGISVGKNKTVPDEQAPEAHAHVVDRLYDLGDYFVINVSSPNTPGLRALQDKKPLTAIITAVQEVMDKHGARKPLFVKIAPDLTNDAIDDVIEVVEKTKINGIIAVNTSLDANIKGKYKVQDSRLEQTDKTGKRRTWADEMGGLSGDDADYRKRAVEVVRHIYATAQQKGMDITVIGVGGIKDAQSALEMIKAGATLVQVLTAIRGEGPAVAGNITRGIAKEMRRMKITNYNDLVGYDVRHSKR